MSQHVTEESPSHELFAVLAVDCGWVSNELEERFDALKAKIRKLRKALPNPDCMETLAAWIDGKYPNDSNPTVQNDLRSWSCQIRDVLKETSDE